MPSATIFKLSTPSPRPSEPAPAPLPPRPPSPTPPPAPAPPSRAYSVQELFGLARADHREARKRAKEASRR